MNKNLSSQYFYLCNGDIDPFTGLIDCFNVHLYFTLRNKIGNIINPYGIFLRDIAFYVSQNEDGAIYDVDFIDNSLNEDVFKLQYFKGKGYETFSNCEALLDKGEPVIIYTDTRKVPFFNDNQGEGTEPTNAGVELGHVFMVIQREGDLLYYVEAPWNINLNNYTPFEGNKSVGVINKSDLKAAFDSFLTYITVKVEESSLHDAPMRLKQVINNTVENYHKKTHKSKGLTLSYGLEGIDRLIEACGREFMYLDQKALSCSLNLFSLLDWRIVNINRRRILLLESLKTHSRLIDNRCINHITDIIDSDIKSWQSLLTAIRKMNIRKKYLLDKGLQKYLMEVRKMEDEMVAGLLSLKEKCL
ncbi:MAG: hypothetical protein ACOYWZ_19575 [Bacillota bacterium]